MALPVPRAVRVALGLARLCALVVCAAGALVLASWHFDLSALEPLFPHLHSMAPNAAAAAIAAGIGLFCLTFRGLRPFAWLIGFALVLLGGATIFQDLYGFDLGIDRVEFRRRNLPTEAEMPYRLATVAPLNIGLELAEANALWRAQRQGQDAEAKLKASRDLQAIIRKERDPDQLLERATAQLADVFGADGVSIMLADAHGELSVRTSRGLSEAAKLDRKRIGEGISGTVAQTGRSMLLSGQVQGGSDPTASESMIAPLRSNGKTLGVVNVKHRASQERYGQTQVDSLTQAASDIAAAYLTAGEFQRAFRQLDRAGSVAKGCVGRSGEHPCQVALRISVIRV